MPRLFITIILIFGATIIAFFYLGPEWKTFQALRTETEELQAISGELDDLNANRENLLGTINSISKEDLDRIEKILPEGSHAAEFLVLLEGLTKKRGLILSRIDLSSSLATKQPPVPAVRAGGTPLAVKSSLTFNELPITLNIAGPYGSFKAFLADLEKNIRIIDTQDITFNASGKEDSFGYTLQIKTYYQ